MNEPVIYQSARRFTVSRWAQGHTGLVLLSVPRVGDTTRVEVLFKPAYAVVLPDYIDGLTIRRCGWEAVPAGLHREQRYAQPFQLETENASGLVVAGGVHGRQDQGDYADPTMFDGWEPRDGVTDLFSWVTPDERPAT